jgi:hypothetical protein
MAVNRKLCHPKIERVMRGVAYRLVSGACRGGARWCSHVDVHAKEKLSAAQKNRLCNPEVFALT